jgi:hypothetical protein
MAKTYTVLQFADRLEKLSKNLNKAILPPFRKDLKIMQRALYAEYWKNPFAARIWKWTEGKFAWTTSGRSGGSVFTGRKSGPAVRLGKRKRGRRQLARWSHSEGAYIAQINISGLAARMPVYERVVENRLFGEMVGHVEEKFWKFVEREL